MNDQRPIDCLHGYRKPARCQRGCRQAIVWVMDIGGVKGVHRPFRLDATPIEVFERENGVKVDRYAPDAFHSCPPKRR